MKNIYLTAGAWGMIYQLGAISRLRDTITKNNTTLYGCSAGALSWIMFLLYDDARILELYRSFVSNAHEIIQQNPLSYDSYNLTVHHFKMFEIINKEFPDAYLKINGKVNVGITTENKFEWHNTFKSNKDMFNVLLCSFHVPFLCSYNAKIGDIKCIDGGYGIDYVTNLPSDCFVICPKDYKSPHQNHVYINGNIPILFCIVPPVDMIIMYYYNKGIQDVIKYSKTGKSASSSIFAYDEFDLPINVWWILRTIQPDDTKNLL